MIHFGDITKIDGHKLPVVDVVTGGSPCQDLSVAGKRAGLAGERSGLFMEQIRVIKEMREEYARTHGPDDMVRPRWMVWENVPGAFSSNGGEDFRAVLEETARVAEKNAVIPGPPGGKWPLAGCIVGNGFSLAWRTHDAQYHGVPQRRRRICLLADFCGLSAPEILFELRRETADAETEQTVGDTGGASAPEILFERKGLSGDSEPGGAERKETAARTTGGAKKSSKCLNPWDIQCKRIQSSDGVADALYSGEQSYTGGESNVLQEVMACGSRNHQKQTGTAYAFMGGQGSKAGSIGYGEEIAPSLKAVPSGGNTVPDVMTYGIDQQGGKGGANYSENTSPPICSDSHGTPHAVCYESRNLNDVAATITATYGTKWNGNAGAYNGENFVIGTNSNSQ